MQTCVVLDGKHFFLQIWIEKEMENEALGQGIKNFENRGQVDIVLFLSVMCNKNPLCRKALTQQALLLPFERLAYKADLGWCLET